jgi:NTP pyrophosphatase (non-canonical NTP hydrolase)
MSQAIKTLEETTELLDAINKNDIDEIKDAVGDIVVTLIMVCAVKDIDLVSCLDGAYQQIKDRKGYLTPQGTFVKQ